MTRQRRLDTAAGRLPLGGGWAFAGAAVTFTSVYLAAGALMPLLVVYKERWALPATLLTLAFAVFAVGFLVAVLILGSLSDHVGRRPVLIGALIVQLASNVMFLVAPDIGWVIAAASCRASPPVPQRLPSRLRSSNSRHRTERLGRDPRQRQPDRRARCRILAGGSRDSADD